MATIDRFFAKNQSNLMKDADHAQLPGLNEYVLIQEGNSSFQMKDVSLTMKMISHQIFSSLPAAAETNQYKQLCRSSPLIIIIIIIIMTSHVLISSKIKSSAATKSRD